MAATFADVVGLVLESLAHARAEAFGLDDGGHEKRDILEAAAVREGAHGGAAHDAHADIFLQAAAFVDEGAFHASRDLGEGGVEGKAGLHADAEQIEYLGQLAFDLFLSAVNGCIEENNGHQAAEKAQQEDHHGFLDGRKGATAHEYGGKEPHDDGTEQAAAKEFGDAPFAGFAGKYEAFLDDGAQALGHQVLGQFFQGLFEAARLGRGLDGGDGFIGRHGKGVVRFVHRFQAGHALADGGFGLYDAPDDAEEYEEYDGGQRYGK